MPPNAHLAPGYREGLKGIARSMPTSAAADRVAEKLGIGMYETPTGWKFFGNLLDAGLATICGEERTGPAPTMCARRTGCGPCCFGSTSSPCAAKAPSRSSRSTGPNMAATTIPRHDYEAVETDRANALVEELRGKLATMPGTKVGALTIAAADDFAYHDPVDQSVSSNQGVRILFEGGSRAVFRLSGTGTSGATLRVYIKHSTRPGQARPGNAGRARRLDRRG